jgi:hypothetical protein
MRNSKYRRLDRLELLASAYIEEQKRRDEATEAWLRASATEHAVRLAAVVHHGQPSIDEPLSAASERALDALVGDRPVLRESFRAAPKDKDLAAYLHSLILRQLQGGTEAEKLQHGLDRAPPWLLVFTVAAWTASILELKLPPLGEAPMCGVGAAKEALDKWPYLPECRFDTGGHPPSCFEGLDIEDLLFWHERTRRPYEDLTRHERRRLNQINDKRIWSKIDLEHD